MKQVVKNKWLKALRSGKYQQGRGDLKSGNSFCCLGVLTDLYIKENKKVAAWAPAGGFELRNKDGNLIEHESALLPRAVQKWAGLRTDNPKVKIGSGTEHLSEVNDHIKKDFKDIAHRIKVSL